MKFTHPVQIREHHLDTFGHVNNAKYLEILEDVRWDIITKGGFGLKDVMTKKIGPVILAIDLQFKKELRLRENISVVSECVDYSGKICKMVQTMLKESGEEGCVATFTFGLFDLNVRKLIAPTPDWLKAIGMQA